MLPTPIGTTYHLNSLLVPVCGELYAVIKHYQQTFVQPVVHKRIVPAHWNKNHLPVSNLWHTEEIQNMPTTYAIEHIFHHTGSSRVQFQSGVVYKQPISPNTFPKVYLKKYLPVCNPYTDYEQEGTSFCKEANRMGVVQLHRLPLL